MGQGLADHFALVALGTLATQLVLGMIAFYGFYVVGKRIISVEIPGVIRGVNERMEKLERGLETLHKDLIELRREFAAFNVTAAERQGMLQTLTEKVRWIEDARGRRPPRG
jgi:hypothetical protein